MSADGFSGTDDLGLDRLDGQLGFDVDLPLHSDGEPRWRFVPCMDCPGEVLVNLGPGLSADELKWAVLQHRQAGARCVNTDGKIRACSEPPEMWQRFTDDRTRGMWVLADGQPGMEADTMQVARDNSMPVRSQSPFLDQGGASISEAGMQQGYPTAGMQQGYDFGDPSYAFDPHLAMGPGDLIGASTMTQLPQPPQSAKPSIQANKRAHLNNTLDKLKQAQDLQKQAVQSIIANEQAHGKAQKYNGHTNVVAHTIKKKIGKSQDLCKALEDRIESVEDTIRQTGESLFQLQRANRCKWGPLNVCERRLELRSSRPPQENVVDHCQEALEHERQFLFDARAVLSSQMERMRATLIGLDKLKTELSEDLQHKRHALRIDRSCLSPQKPGGVNKSTSVGTTMSHSERLVLPSLQDIAHYGQPSSPKGADAGTGFHNEDARRESTEKLIARAVRVEEDAIRAANESDAMILRTQSKCQEVSAKAQSELSRRVDELRHMRFQLEAQMKQSDETIAATEISMAKTQQAFASHDKPLRALDKQFATRGRRTSREGIRDPVHDEMEGHLETLKKSVKGLSDKMQASKDILQKLRESKQHMQEDYRNKVQAQKIDDACIKITARKSMELDRTDPRGGRCTATPRKKNNYLQHSLEAGFLEQIKF